VWGTAEMCTGVCVCVGGGGIEQKRRLGRTVRRCGDVKIDLKETVGEHGLD
jgi:hypothetical protein